MRTRKSSGEFFYQVRGMARWQQVVEAFLGGLSIAVFVTTTVLLARQDTIDGVSYSFFPSWSLMMLPFLVVGVMALLMYRGATAWVRVVDGHVIVRNTYATHRFEVADAKLVFGSLASTATAGWVAYGSPNNDNTTMESSPNRPKFRVDGRRRLVRVAAMRGRTKDSSAVKEMAEALSYWKRRG